MIDTPRTPGIGGDTLLRHLVDRFLAGDTTPADERRIYDYYRSHSLLPPDLEQYRAMFRWYDNAAGATAQPARPRRRGRTLTVVLAAAAIAAMLTVGGLGGWLAVKISIGGRADRLEGSVSVSKRAAADTIVIYEPADTTALTE